MSRQKLLILNKKPSHISIFHPILNGMTILTQD
jgi:hypothetical protein